MSWQASSWARARKTGSPARKAVLLCLAEGCDQWGFVWSGELMIADDAELSDRHVRRIVRDLAEVGLITIFQGRGAHGARRNLYRLNFAAKPKDPMPEEHPSQGDRYQHHAGFEDLDAAIDHLGAATPAKPPDKMSGGATGQDVRSPPDKSSQTTGQIEPNDRTPVSGEPIRTDKNLKTRARATDRPEGSVAPDAEHQDQDGAETPVNAHWRARQDRLERYFGDVVAYRLWVRDVIPHADDGETLVLAVPSRFIGEEVAKRYRSGMERILERRVTFKITEYAKIRAAQRKRQDQRKAAS